MQGTALKKEKLNGLERIIIEQVWPEIDCGRFPIKRCIQEQITVQAIIFAEGHDEIGAALHYRHNSQEQWQTVTLQSLGNDRWQAVFTVTQIGEYVYTIQAWIDEFGSWRRNLLRWIEARQDINTELLIGAELIQAASQRATATKDKERLQFFATALQNPEKKSAQTYALDEELFNLMKAHPNLTSAAHYEKQLKVTVDRERARFSSWYEVFPRSLGAKHKHGTFKDLINYLPYIAQMGFDIIYLPPIHPIGKTFRKGKNNATTAEANDPGSPWGIGSSEGGHTEIHPQLGSWEDFQLLLNYIKELGMEIALDLALQCTPDHPYVKQHPQWFKHLPDGTIQYAENPPKKYQDIYPLNFQSEKWSDLWDECLQMVLFWINKGVRIFRVDNPHTKPFPFWEWLISNIKAQYPEVLFLSEAFTRPNIMYYLAKSGFTQSYTYFTWRNSKQELTEYMTELNNPLLRQFFRPNLWPNTPDILHEYLQTGGRPAFITRLILAATLSSNYGIYGPTYELCVNQAREANSEEYLDSEKYAIREWDLHQPHSLAAMITQVNKIRQENACLQSNLNLNFHFVDNEQIICYCKFTDDKKNILVMVINLDPHHSQSGWLEFPIENFGINSHETYLMHDLITDAKYLWQGSRNYVELDPQKLGAHIFKIYPHIHHEQDFKGY